MRHISLIVWRGGQLICGLKRTEVKEGDTTAHWPHNMMPDQEEEWRKTVCPECLAIWDECAPEEESDDDVSKTTHRSS